jgi:pyruvate kinase
VRRAKIVCTLGPASAGVENITRLIGAGMDVCRLNFSHGEHATHEQALHDVRHASDITGKPIAILADLSGPKMRFGEMTGGGVDLAAGQTVIITTKNVIGTPEVLPAQCDLFPEGIEPGGVIFADDGKMQFIVERFREDEIQCMVKTSGRLGSRKGLNIPHVQSTKSSLTDKDRRDIAFGKRIGVDYFALSFVRHPRDVAEAKSLAGDIPVIAKIEKPEAIDHLDDICEISDGLMVARGDLGIEAGFEKVPLLQKRMIRAMNRRAKPVITATQMLESMIKSPQPTRAEVSDVGNAVLDGTDAVMLSAESAVGDYPFLATETMARIITEVEGAAFEGKLPPKRPDLVPADFTNAIARAAAGAAASLDLTAVAVYSLSGQSVRMVAAHRPRPIIAGFSNDQSIVRRMSLLWGVVPFFSLWFDTTREVVAQTEHALLASGLSSDGDRIAITFGLQDGGPKGTTTLKLWEVHRHTATP